MRRRLVRSTALLLVLEMAAAATAWAGGALPTGGQFTAGAGSIGQTNNGLVINQATTRGIIDWRSFSIGVGHSVLFNNGGGATLNRVSGGEMSTIAGLLKGTGSVFLVNPAGVLITPSGQVLTGGSFIASSRDVADDLFMSSQALHFIGSSAGDVVNQGSISAANGDVVLVGRGARNDGQISAPNGTAALAAGDDVLLQPLSGDQRVFIKAGTGDATNTGTINAAQAELKAADGNVYALAGNNGGIVRATGTAEVGGHVWLVANGNVGVAGTVAAQNADGSGGEVTVAGGAASGTLSVSGTVDASAQGAQPGGTITMTAADIDLGGSAVVAANGGSGGTILIGGDRHGGQDPSIDFLQTSLAAAQETVIESGATISASGSAGDGGKIVVWADQSTSFAGAVAARGAQGGNGGFAEVSGEVLLDFTGMADLSAPGGLVGTLLLDPRQVTISSGSNSNISGGPTFSATGNDAVLNVNTLETALASNNVIVNTGSGSGGQNGDITVASGVSWSSANSLTLTAASNTGSIFVNAGITSSGSGALTLNGTNVTLGATVQAPTVTINATGTVTQSAQLKATALDLLGTGAAYTLTNAANQIGTLAANTGSINLADNASLTLGTVGGTNGATASGNLTLHVTGSGDTLTVSRASRAGGTLTAIADNGNITIASGASLRADGAGNSLIVEAGASSAAGTAAGGDFINNAGSSALNASASGAHFLVYTGDPVGSGTVDGGLSYTTRYDTAVGFTPGSAGNYFLVRAAPTLTITANNLGKVYGAALPTLTYTVTGLAGNDTQNAALGGAPNLSTTATASSSVAGGPYAITIAAGGITNPLNYQLSFVNGQLTVTPLTVTLSGLLANNKVYDTTVNATLNTGSATLNGVLAADSGNVTLATGGSTAVFADANVGTAKAITVSGLSLQGSAAGNYTLTQPTGLTANITPAALTVNNVTANSKTYDATSAATLNLGSASLNGLLGSDSGHVNVSATGTVANFASANVGNGVAVTVSSIGLTGSAAGNYVVSPPTGLSADITPATLTYVANSASRSFGAANPGFSGTVSGFLGSDTLANATTGTLAFTSPATATSNVGAYAINGNGLSATNYTLAQAAGNATALTITPAVLTYTANAASRTYGAANPAFSGTITGFVNGDTQASATTGTLSFTSPATAGSNVESYAVNGSGLSANNGNYSFAQAAGNATALTITPAVLTYTASSASRTFGAANPVFAGTVTGFVNGDTQATATTGTLSFISPATASSNVGSYAINGSGLSANNGNYTFAEATGNATALTITPAVLTYTADSATRMFGAANPVFSGTVTGFVNGDTLASATTGALNFASPATASSNVGSYAINGSGLTANNGNYTFVQAAANATALTITPATLTVVANNLSKTYGAADPALTFTASGFQLTDSASSVLTGALSRVAGESVAGGPYAITQGTLAANSNYTIAFTPGALTINPATLTIVANNLGKTYGAADPALTFTAAGFQFSDSAATVLTGALTRVAGESVAGGPYAITQGTLAANSNYNITFTQGALTINPATLTVVADNLSKTYGAADPALTFTVSGFAFTDTAGSVLAGALTRTAGETVAGGPYAITQGTLSANGNYAIAFTPGDLAITPAVLTYSANPASRTYGAANPVFSGTITGFVNGDTQASATTGTLNFTSPATAASNVGSYAIDGSGLVANNGNYSFVQAAANATALTITPAVLSYIANAASRTYGTAIPAFSGTITGFVNGDTQASATTGTASFTSPATAASNVGSYAINGSGLAANHGNYTFVQAAGNAAALTVTPATLTVIANNLAKTYGGADPVLTFTASGFELSDTASTVLTGALSRVAGQSVAGGPYAITQGTLAANGNYTIAFTPGALTINPATLTIVANNLSKTYGSADPVLTFAASGFQFADTTGSVLTGALRRAVGESVAGGPYAITRGTLAANSNYAVAFTSGALTIDPATLTIVANAVSRPVGDTNPPFTGTVTGFVNGDTLASATTGTLSFSSAATATSPVGRYAILGAGLTPSANYVLVQAAANATALTLTPTAATAAAVTPPPLVTATPHISVDLFAGGDVCGAHLDNALALQCFGLNAPRWREDAAAPPPAAPAAELASALQP